MSDDEQNYGYEEGGADDYGGYEDENGGDEYQGEYEQEEDQYEQEEEEEEVEDEPAEKQEEREDHYKAEPEEAHEDFVEDEDEDWREGEETVAYGFSSNAEKDGGPCETATAKGVFDGFEGGFGGLISKINHLAGGESGGLSNIFTSGGLEGTVKNMISEAAHRFVGIDAHTGAIIGAIAGNLIFKMGGKQNSLGGIGKMILENIITGKFHRDVHPFVPPVATGTTTRFGLNFHEERDRCLRERRLFEDPEFPASDRSLYYKTPPEHSVQWLRPGEIVSDPQLIVGQQSRFAVKQGALGDCWLLAAIANLTLRDELFYRVVVPDQSFTENYAGLFHFQFWRYGKWIDVVIDDKLPCSDGHLIYMHSHDGSEFWSALLEKAKISKTLVETEFRLTQNYTERTRTWREAPRPKHWKISQVRLPRSNNSVTGGLTEFFHLRKTDKATILALLIRGMQLASLFGCSIDADSEQKEMQLENGLVRGHAYSITALHSVNVRGQDIPLIRIRNPWGNSKEWNGAWSDSASEWNWISEEERQKLGVNFSKDGEFWMSFDDFFVNFQELEICNMSAEVMNEIMQMTGVRTEVAQLSQSSWSETQEDGEWSNSNNTAGGCTNSPETYPNNPQFGSMFTVTEKSVEKDGKCTVIVAVLQKYRRELRTQGKDSLPIGFAVYEIDSNHYGPLPRDFFHGRKSVARNKVFINTREVTARFRVVPGSYVIVPCTFEPGCDGEFLLRVYANGELQTARLR